MNMTTQNTEALLIRASGLEHELSAYDDFLHAMVEAPRLLHRQEAEAAQRLHRQICEPLVHVRRIHLWLTFRPRALMAWNGSGLHEIDISAFSVDRVAKYLGALEDLLRANRRDIKTIRKAIFRLDAAISRSGMGRRTA
jgi:hypothetical protein